MLKSILLCGCVYGVVFWATGCVSGLAVGGHRSGVLQEVWEGVPGDAVTDLTGAASYAGAADAARLLPSLEYADQGDNYGSRCSALVTVPATGSYTFWLASDDGGELWLSPDGTVDGLRQVASVSNWTGEAEWTSQPTQQSEPVTLTAGQPCLLRTLHKQGGGGNHLSVAWAGPGFEREPIPAERLRLPPLAPDIAALLKATEGADAARAALVADVEALAAEGTTLPAELTAKLTVSAEGPPPEDTGINVLVDQAHQTQFAVLWGLRGQIRSQGFRVCSSVACLDTVLEPGRLSRIRAKVGGMEPFAWHPNPEFNVVVTSQQDLNAQLYTEAERQALRRFVSEGGGLVVFGTRPRDAASAASWGLNQAVEAFGAAYTSESDTIEGARRAVLALDNAGWETTARGRHGGGVRARRVFGKGRVVLMESTGPVNARGGDDEAATAAKQRLLRETLLWAAAGREPVGGDHRMPHMGGVGIFPELEQNLGSVVVYYAGNQKPDVLTCIQEHIPRAAKQVRGWLPSKTFAEPYNIVICAGGGGGWAINGRPKAAAVISYDALGILGIFAHEMAHTMGGPRNALGELAGRSPHHNQGEAHAGWFQGKIHALFSGDTDVANRNCNRILELEAQKGRLLDVAREHQTPAGREFWGKGPEWTKLWYIFQKLDDRYGPTWYPRWYWVRATRWRDEPGHAETWDEMVEDMSIAVGEDLFPFMKAVGTTLEKERLPAIEFQGRTLTLPVAPIQPTPAGNVCLDPIGDYTQPLTPRG